MVVGMLGVDIHPRHEAVVHIRRHGVLRGVGFPFDSIAEVCHGWESAGNGRSHVVRVAFGTSHWVVVWLGRAVRR